MKVYFISIFESPVYFIYFLRRDKGDGQGEGDRVRSVDVSS